MQQRGVVTLTFQDLAKLLGLNDEHKVVGVHFEFIRQRLCVLIDGPEMPKVWDGDLLAVVRLEDAQAR